MRASISDRNGHPSDRGDYHPSFQQIAFVNTETGELGARRLLHRAAAEQFYLELKQRNAAVRVGMESRGHSRWFERLLGDLQCVAVEVSDNSPHGKMLQYVGVIQR
jgi:hypothetical protein